MTDKELLELAAKAAGFSDVKYNNPANPHETYMKDGLGGDFWRSEGVLYWLNEKWSFWNPLTDDGDALRLAVKLNLTIKIYGANTMVYDMNDKFLADFVDCETDTATRRAIVRAAAEIGRMK